MTGASVDRVLAFAEYASAVSVASERAHEAVKAAHDATDLRFVQRSHRPAVLAARGRMLDEATAVEALAHADALERFRFEAGGEVR